MAAGGYGGYGKRNHIKNFGCLWTIVLWAGILSLIQSLIWMGLNIVGIIAYTCNMPINTLFTYGSLMEYAFYTLYFKGNCIPSDYQQFDRTMLDSVSTVLSPEDILIWNCVYLAVAFCWCITAVLLLTMVRKDNITHTSVAIYSWIVAIACISLMDLALGIIFGIDYGKFNRAAYNYNLSSINAGAIDPQAAQLVAGGVAAISLMLISFKGFILWLINVGLMCYLLKLVVGIAKDKDHNDTLFMPPMTDRDSDDIISNRPPIKAYEEDITTKVYTNDAFVPDNRSVVTVELNQDALARAARMSSDILTQGARFRNVEAYQQYPPLRLNNNNNIAANNNNHFVKQASINDNVTVIGTASSPDVISPYPVPDYTPPMSRAANGGIHNQRYQ
ncbi:uncharacterized protein LOC126763644 [Bactrocera neohumeralis]|uniref:uncharacterized protein LOC126763644 n=1 Tax=Bactrocera neohumeralis TaxID=98809 RepID=UPI002165A87F|nr:uncharacterized protein LOC126763644 [Bactrocera neohumeralis]XP_050337309.1 uncharacterized protein LOC126763644 [Bactrocera neohumeralis]